MEEEKQYELEDLTYANKLIKEGSVNANPEHLAKVVASVKAGKVNPTKSVDIIDLLLKT